MTPSTPSVSAASRHLIVGFWRSSQTDISRDNVAIDISSVFYLWTRKRAEGRTTIVSCSLEGTRPFIETIFLYRSISYLSNKNPNFPRQNLAHILHKTQYQDSIMTFFYQHQTQPSSKSAFRRQDAGGVSQSCSRLRQFAHRSERVLHQPSQCDLFSLCDR